MIKRPGDFPKLKINLKLTQTSQSIIIFIVGPFNQILSKNSPFFYLANLICPLPINQDAHSYKIRVVFFTTLVFISGHSWPMIRSLIISSVPPGLHNPLRGPISGRPVYNRYFRFRFQRAPRNGSSLLFGILIAICFSFVLHTQRSFIQWLLKNRVSPNSILVQIIFLIYYCKAFC